MYTPFVGFTGILTGGGIWIQTLAVVDAAKTPQIL